MFTGITQELGSIRATRPISDGIEADVACSGRCLSELAIGDSIAINGVCSTAVLLNSDYFTVQFLRETLNKTTFKSLAVGDKVNLELALTPSSRIGGHIVTGHVDETGTITLLESTLPFGKLRVSYNPANQHYLIPKGSICIDGVSLTIAALEDHEFECHLITHTLAHTSIGLKKAGDSVNLEYDMMGKYLYRFHEISRQSDLKKIDFDTKSSML